MAASTGDFVTCGGCGEMYRVRLKGCPFCGAPLKESFSREDIEGALADARARNLGIADLMDAPEISDEEWAALDAKLEGES